MAEVSHETNGIEYDFGHPLPNVATEIVSADLPRALKNILGGKELIKSTSF